MATNTQIQLRIVRPRDGLYYGLVSSKTILKIKVQAFSSQTRIDDVKFLTVLSGWNVGILLNGEVVVIADHVDDIKATYSTTVDLRSLSDGTHTLQAVLQKQGSASRPAQIVDSDIVNFIIDRNLPTITSVLPSNGMKIEDRAFSRVLVEASGGLTGLYTKRSTVTIDKKIYKNPVEHKKGLVFSIPIPPKQGIHKLKLTVFDKAGNKSTRTTKFEIIETAAQAEEQDWRERRGVVEEKLVSDIRFRKLLFTDARAAFAENGIPFTRAASSALPPPLSEEHANFFASVNSDLASQKWDAMTQRAFQESPSRNDARIAQIREKLGSQGATTEDGNLTNSAKDLVSEILQDPQRFLESLGVTPSEEEKPFIFPSYSEVDAKAFADWFSMTLTGKQPEPSEERQTNLQEISNKVSNDPDLLFKWLTKPAETYKEMYPDATARDMAFLPDPISEDEARRIIDSRSPTTTTSTSQNTPHNSSDIVVGFSMEMLNEMLGLYFTTLEPGILPKTFTSDLATGQPSPNENTQCEININQPGDLRVSDPEAKLLSATSSGSASITRDGTLYSYDLSLTPIYAILLKEEKVFLKLDRIDVQVTDRGTGIPDPTASTAIKNFIENEVRTQYPNGEIYLVDQKPMNINIPFADVAVDIHRIWVHDDTDPGGSGELYFGIGIDGKEYLFGQFDADSGSTIEISRRFMLKKGGSSFPVQIQGIDMDMGVWPDSDDPLGGSMRLNSTSVPGTYTLRGVTPITSYELVWEVIEFVLHVICWLVAIFLACFGWLFFFIALIFVQHCNSWVEKIMGWVRKGTTTDLHTYTLEYSIVPLNPVTISISANEPQVANNGLYLSFDFSIPEVGDKSAKTEAVGFVGSSDLGIALSENLINKIISAWWRYSPVSKRITTPYGTRLFYAHVDLDQPELNLVPAFSGPFPIGSLPARVSLRLATAGVAGTNLGPVHATLGLPSGVEASILLSLQGRNLTFLINSIYFLGDNLATFLANLVSSYAYNFEADKDKKSLVMDLAPNLRLGLEGADYELNPTAPVQINDNELIMKFSTEIAPTILIEPNMLDFFLELEKILRIKNVGNEMLTITEFAIDDNLFSLVEAPDMPLNIPPKEEVDITIHIEDPSWKGLHEGTLSIHNNDPARPVVPVRLVALDKPIIEVTHLYPAIMAGDPYWATATWLGFDQYNGSKEIFIRNKGHADLTVERIHIENRFFSSDVVPLDESQKFPSFTLPPYDPNNKDTEKSVVITIDTNKLNSSGFGSPSVEDGKLIIESDDELTQSFTISLHAQQLSGGDSNSGGGSSYQ